MGDSFRGKVSSAQGGFSLTLSAAAPGLSGLPLNRINAFLPAGRRILQGRQPSEQIIIKDTSVLSS